MAGRDGAPLRVCYFNRSYWPDTGATGQLLTELAEDLVAVHGLEVTVVTGYPVGAAGTLPARDTRNGVRIIRARGTTLSPRKFTHRALNYLTYFLSAVWAAVWLPKQDVTIALTDPPIIGLAALAARPRPGLVFYCQDIFPEVAGLLEDFHSPAINALLDRLNRFLGVRIRAWVELREQRLRHDQGRAAFVAPATIRSAARASSRRPSLGRGPSLEYVPLEYRQPQLRPRFGRRRL